MARPGFTLEVDERTPRLLRISGADIGLQRFGPGTHVVYPADAESSSDPVPLIDAALDSPVGGPPLAELLRPGTTLTIVVTSDEAIRPRIRFDARRSIVERTLQQAARLGVEDVQIVIATGLRRGWTDKETTRILGDRVATSFMPDHLISTHDVTADDLVTVAEVDGHPVKVNKRISESDLVVLVGLRSSHDTPCLLSVGATDVGTIDRIQGHRQSPGFAGRVADALQRAIPTFSVMAVLGQPLLGRTLSFMNRREWEWRLAEHSGFASTRQVLNLFPRQGASRLFRDVTADYSVVDVIGGEPSQVHREAGEAWVAAHAVAVPTPADIAITSVWGAEFEARDPMGTPMAAAHHALVTRLGSHLGNPLIRPGGVVVAFHPLHPRFPHRAQAAAADFYSSVLTETLDPGEIAAQYEPRAADDEWYVKLYREHFADHPLTVYHRWYRMAEATKDTSNVIWVTGNRRTAALMGHRSATTLPDALEIASDFVGTDPAMLYLRSPGPFVGRVA